VGSSDPTERLVMTEVKNVLNISTGAKKIWITRDGSATEEFIEINPTDVGFADRFFKLLKDLNDSKTEIVGRYDELEGMEGKDVHGIPLSTGPTLEYSKKVCQDLLVKIDEVFGNGVSQKVFGDTLKMEVIEQFFKGILPYVEEARAPMIEKYGPPVIKKHRKKRASKK
jgi:hypothetical protein